MENTGIYYRKFRSEKGKNSNMIIHYILLFLSTYFLIKIIIEEIITKIILNKISYKNSLNEFIRYSNDK